MVRWTEEELDGESISKSGHALLKGAKIKSSKEECALDTGQSSSDAAVKGAQSTLRKVECV
jgi:hypothetical protein